MRPARPLVQQRAALGPCGRGTTYHSPALRRGEAQAPALGGRRLRARCTPPAHTSEGREGVEEPRAACPEPRSPLLATFSPGLRHSPIPAAGPRRPWARWRRVATLLSSPRSSRFLRSEKALSLEVLEGGLLPRSWLPDGCGSDSGSVRAPWPSGPPPGAHSLPIPGPRPGPIDTKQRARPEWATARTRHLLRGPPARMATLSEQEAVSDTKPPGSPALPRPGARA